MAAWSTSSTPLPDTATRMLDVAERLVQQRGFNAFSYADIASELGVTKASLHYHFASKAALGSAVIDRYALRFFDALDAIDARRRHRRGAPRRLRRGLRRTCSAISGCACAACSPPTSSPSPTRCARPCSSSSTARSPGSRQVLERGVADGSLAPIGSVTEAAKTLVWSIEGAMLVARAYDDVAELRARRDPAHRGPRPPLNPEHPADSGSIEAP